MNDEQLLQEARVVRVLPGDVVMVHCDQGMTMAESDQISQQLKNLFPHNHLPLPGHDGQSHLTAAMGKEPA